jgi:ligand-binding SRPBCC domain-containing protein
MKIYKLEREQVINKPIEQVFAFFEKPENLATITPPSMQFNILTPFPLDMKTGSIIDYAIKIFGFRIHWRTIIAGYDPPSGFVDEQLKGPYAFWRHKHQFEKIENGSLIRDKVNYALPFGYLGRLVHMIFVKRQLQHIFNYRSTAIKEIFAL